MTAAPTYRTVLVGVDFSRSSRQALRHAHALARTLGARLEVAHAVPRLRPALPFSAENRRVVARLQRESLTEARAALARLVAGVKDVPVHAAVLRGEPSAQLLAHARRRRADLLVVGQRGQNLAEALLIGSTAERVARRSRVPVVLVPNSGTRGR